MNVAHILKTNNITQKPKGKSQLNDLPKNTSKRDGVKLEKEKIINTLKLHKDLCISHLSKISGVSSHTTNITINALKEDGAITISDYTVQGRKTFAINLKATKEV